MGIGGEQGKDRESAEVARQPWALPGDAGARRDAGSSQGAATPYTGPPVAPSAPPPSYPSGPASGSGLPPAPGPPARGAGVGRRQILALSAVVLAVALVLAGVVVVGPKIGDDEASPVRDGGRPRRPNIEVADGPQTMWSHELSGPVADVVADDERVCAIAERELVCLDAESGDEIFAVDLPGDATRLMLSGDTVVVASAGLLHGYNFEGDQVWQTDAPSGVSAVRNVHGAPVAGSAVGFLEQRNEPDEFGFHYPVVEWVALDAASGSETWRVRPQAGMRQTTSPANYGLMSDGSRLYGMVSSPIRGPVTADDLKNLDPADPVDAQVLAIVREWTYEDPTDSNDVLDDWEIDLQVEIGLLDTVNQELVDRGTPSVAAIDPASGAEQWRFAIEGLGEYDSAGVASAVSLPDIGAVALTIESATTKVVVLDAATGALRWETSVDAASADVFGSGPANTVAHHDGVTMVVDGAEVRGYDDTGRELWVAEPDPGTDAPDLDVSMNQLLLLDDHVLLAGLGVYEIDPADGDVELIDRRVATDATLAGKTVVLTEYDTVEAVAYVDRCGEILSAGWAAVPPPCDED